MNLQTSVSALELVSTVPQRSRYSLHFGVWIGRLEKFTTDSKTHWFSRRFLTNTYQDLFS